MKPERPGRAQPSVLVAAVGNPDRADDGVGPLVARKLWGKLPAEAKLVVRSGDLMSLIEDWAGVDAVICVDASAPRGEPGRVLRIDLAEEDLPPDLSFTSSHAFGLAEAIALGRVLELAPQRMIVYAIEGVRFDAGVPMADEVTAAAAAVVDRIAAEVCHITASRAKPPEVERSHG